MIVVNEKIYNTYSVNILWGNFYVSSYDKKIKGIAPFIKIKLDDDILIELEFIFSKERFEDTQLNEKINIDKYISDIAYVDEKGWVSIITGKYHCNITRISRTDFNIELNVNFEEIDTININMNINMTLL